MDSPDLSQPVDFSSFCPGHRQGECCGRIQKVGPPQRSIYNSRLSRSCKPVQLELRMLEDGGGATPVKWEMEGVGTTGPGKQGEMDRERRRSQHRASNHSQQNC